MGGPHPEEGQLPPQKEPCRPSRHPTAPRGNPRASSCPWGRRGASLQCPYPRQELPLTDPAGWHVGAPCVVAPSLEFSPTWGSTWAPFIHLLYMGHPPPAASERSIWAPKPPSSPELCPLPHSPSGDPQPKPHGPHHPRDPFRAHYSHFQL